MKYGKIAIFANEKKHDKQPDFKGKITVTEAMPIGEYEVGIYNTESKGGLKYQSGVITDPWKKPDDQQEQPKQEESPSESYSSEEIPF